MILEETIFHRRFQFFLIFAIAFGFFLFFQFQIPDFLGRDAYYHLKMAKFMAQGEFIFDQFPWLYFTTLRQHFVDQHFLFHLFLAPFLFLGEFFSEGAEGEILGAKIAAAFFASASVIVFYLILQKNKIKGSFFWTILLLGASSGFVFRMNLVQAQSLAMFWLFLAFLFLTQKKYFWLLPVSFFYTWTHGGFILILVMVGVWCVATFFNYRNGNQKGKNSLRSSLKIKKLKINWKLEPGWRHFLITLKPLLFVTLGLFFGALLHPYFPKLLPFLKTQLFQTGPFAKIQVGAEWYPYEPKNLLLGSSLVFLALIFSGVTFFINKISKNKFVLESKMAVPIFTLLILCLFFFSLTMRSQRFIEYLTPFVILMTAFLLSPSIKNFFQNYKEFLEKFTLVKSLVLSMSLIFILAAFVFTLAATKKSFKAAHSFHREYQQAALWLSENTSKNSLIFHVDWSDFPPLFYYHDQNYYIAGLDPTFFYQYDKDLYQKYEDILRAKNFEKAPEIIKKDFKSDYLVINNKFKKLEERIKENKKFRMVYQNDYLRIYKVL